MPVGVRSKAQVHHQGDGPGLLGAAIYAAISEGSARPTQSPEQGGGCHVMAYQNSLSAGLLAINLCWLCSLILLSECDGSAWLCLGGVLACCLPFGRLCSVLHYRCRRAMP